MKPQKLKKLPDLFGRDLAGWKIAQCHILEIDHGLMGSFAAITTKGEVVVVLDKSSLKKVWDRLERRPAKVTTFIALVHPETGVAFDMDYDYKMIAGPLYVLTDKQIDELCREENPFRWTPGLIGGTEPIRDPVFV